jgi:uncharacterized SAM-dependent methyltransferase
VTLTNPTLTPVFIDAVASLSSTEAGATRELTDGLLAPQASVQPKYFYNALGSKLFEAITQLDEYYPTRTEASIFEANYSNIARAVHDAGVRDACLIDLGAGNCAKAAALMPHLAPKQYVPIDISVDFLREAAAGVQASCICPMPCKSTTACFSTRVQVWATSRRQKRWHFCSNSQNQIQATPAACCLELIW